MDAKRVGNKTTRQDTDGPTRANWEWIRAKAILHAQRSLGSQTAKKGARDGVVSLELRTLCVSPNPQAGLSTSLPYAVAFRESLTLKSGGVPLGQVRDSCQVGRNLHPIYRSSKWVQVVRLPATKTYVSMPYNHVAPAPCSRHCALDFSGSAPTFRCNNGVELLLNKLPGGSRRIYVLELKF